MTVDQPLRDPAKQPSWVSMVPNPFKPPGKPSGMAFAAPDNAYATAP